MGWYRASHFSHVSASPPGWLRLAAAQVKCASCNGGWHGLAGWWCFRRFPETGAGLRADAGANALSVAGSSLAVTNLCLAELRSVSEISRAERLPGLLAGKARRPALFRHGGALQADQAGR